MNFVLTHGAEHAYQIAKVRVGNGMSMEPSFVNAGQKWEHNMLLAQSAAHAKRMGSLYTNYIDARFPKNEAWNLVRSSAMLAVHAKKFRIPAFQQLLEKTKTLRLLEANPSDSHWGTGKNISLLLDNDKFPGKNHCGKSIMSIRAFIFCGTKGGLVSYVLSTSADGNYWCNNKNSLTVKLHFPKFPITFKLRVAHTLACEWVREIVVNYTTSDLVPSTIDDGHDNDDLLTTLYQEIKSLSQGTTGTTITIRRQPLPCSETAAMQQAAKLWDSMFRKVKDASSLIPNIKWEGQFQTAKKVKEADSVQPSTAEPQCKKAVKGNEVNPKDSDNYDPESPSGNYDHNGVETRKDAPELPEQLEINGEMLCGLIGIVFMAY